MIPHICTFSEPEFFDQDYSPRIYVDQAGKPYNFPRKRKREAQIIKLLGLR